MLADSNKLQEQTTLHLLTDNEARLGLNVCFPVDRLPHIADRPQTCCSCQEEDFVAHSFGLPLQTGTAKKATVPKIQPVAALTSAEDELLDARRQSHQQADTSHADHTSDEPLLHRIRFTRSLLEVSAPDTCFHLAHV